MDVIIYITMILFVIIGFELGTTVGELRCDERIEKVWDMAESFCKKLTDK